jgi:hypothetical protein
MKRIFEIAKVSSILFLLYVQITLSQKSNEIDNLKSFATKELELNELRINQDTLIIVSDNRFYYYPFGFFKQVTAFEKATKRIFKRKTEQEFPYADSSFPKEKIFRFTYKESYLKCFIPKNDEFYTGFEIIYGKITNSGIRFNNGIEVGISKASMLNKFFNRFPNDLAETINVIEVESSLLGMWHYYTFVNQKLVSITLDTDYQFPKE